MRFVVTAGPTREHLDPVRFLSNPSTGKMGFAVARAKTLTEADFDENGHCTIRFIRARREDLGLPLDAHLPGREADIQEQVAGNLTRMNTKNRLLVSAFATSIALMVPFASNGAGSMRTNPPSECKAPDKKCGCPGGAEVSSGCIKVNLDMGQTTPWSGSMDCALKIFADNESPSVFTCDSLHAVLGGYTFKRLGQQTMGDGVTPAEVVFSHPNGEPISFVFKNGESMAQPDPGAHIKMDERLMMVDAEGWATASDPVYYDLYVGDGTRRRFLATNVTGALGALVSIADARGITVTPAEMGVDIVYDSNGVRQFLTSSRLADVVQHPGFTGYDVTVYLLQMWRRGCMRFRRQRRSSGFRSAAQTTASAPS